jgi:hypothetical protein
MAKNLSVAELMPHPVTTIFLSQLSVYVILRIVTMSQQYPMLNVDSEDKLNCGLNDIIGRVVKKKR